MQVQETRSILTYPEGATHIVSYEESKELDLGEIPPTLEELNIKNAIPLLPRGKIPPTLKVLIISDIRAGMFIPDTLEHLFIKDYSGTEPLPTNVRVYVHYGDIDNVTRICDHFIFMFDGLRFSHKESTDTYYSQEKSMCLVLKTDRMEIIHRIPRDPTRRLRNRFETLARINPKLMENVVGIVEKTHRSRGIENIKEITIIQRD